MEEGKKHEFDKVVDLSYGIYQAYVDVVETEEGPKIERFGVENGNLKGGDDARMSTSNFYMQTTPIFGIFDGLSIQDMTAKKSCCCADDKMMRDLMGTLLNTEIVTRIDGIDIPARVIDNKYFIVKQDIYGPVQRRCKLVENKNGKLTKFECILFDVEVQFVEDAHNGYAECVVSDEKEEEVLPDADNLIEVETDCIYATTKRPISYISDDGYAAPDYVRDALGDYSNDEHTIEIIDGSEIDSVQISRLYGKIKTIVIDFK